MEFGVTKYKFCGHDQGHDQDNKYLRYNFVIGCFWINIRDIFYPGHHTNRKLIQTLGVITPNYLGIIEDILFGHTYIKSMSARHELSKNDSLKDVVLSLQVRLIEENIVSTHTCTTNYTFSSGWKRKYLIWICAGLWLPWGSEQACMVWAQSPNNSESLNFAHSTWRVWINCHSRHQDLVLVHLVVILKRVEVTWGLT